MVAKAVIDNPVPELAVSDWVQGDWIQLKQLEGHVVLLEVFQVNCPGCFLSSLPQAIELYHRYVNRGLVVLGVATAFEDFDKNTLENLRRLIAFGEVVGETRRCLSEHGRLEHGRWPYKIPFPVAMDSLIKTEVAVNDADVEYFIQQNLPDFARQTVELRQQTRQRVLQYLQGLEYRAETFECFNLRGTPSQILVDKRGILRACRFGNYPELERDVQALLAK